jgi:hypothetical protein
MTVVVRTSTCAGQNRLRASASATSSSDTESWTWSAVTPGWRYGRAAAGRGRHSIYGGASLPEQQVRACADSPLSLAC